tara:strand:- start:238 stop:807 length:570 start_codon:yes stop_codon:yes gene_type:complete
MLNEKRIKESENNVKQYLSDGLLKKLKYLDESIKKVLIKNSKESLNVAEILFKNGHSSLWTIVSSYYAMFYMANAALYKLGYKVEHKIAHKVTADTLIVFVRDKLKDSLLEDYESSKEEALEIAGFKADELIQSFDFETTKFHLSEISGLNITVTFHEILCAQKQPINKWNFEHQKPPNVSLPITCHSS